MPGSKPKISEAVSVAAHQLKTPISVLRGYLEALISGDPGEINEKQKEYLDDIYSENQRSIELVNALLNVSRIEMGAFTIQLSEKNICAIVWLFGQKRPTRKFLSFPEILLFL